MENQKYNSVMGAIKIYNYAARIEEAIIESLENKVANDVEDFKQKLERVRMLKCTSSELTEEEYAGAYSELAKLNTSLYPLLKMF